MPSFCIAWDILLCLKFNQMSNYRDLRSITHEFMSLELISSNILY